MRSIVKKIISVLLSISFVFVSAFDIIYYKETTVCASSTEQIIYDFITNEMGYNAAVAVGFLANIYRESSFDPHADNGYAYGLIQWEGSRRQDLINYCQNNGYDYTTVNGQLHFMQNELQTTEKKAASKLASITNDENGAYDAGYRICYYYERPANKAWKSNDRGNLAKETYWPMYKDDPTPEEWTEVNAQYIVTTQSTNLSFRTGPNTGYSKVTGYEEGIPKGTEVTVLRINSSGTWAHVSWNGIEGYCSMQYLTKKEDVVIEPTPVYPSQPSLSVSAGTSYGKTTLNW
ncbi:MAG: SH3 domain-containing protein, partial [Ruminococcus sp.]|nr:SH3 domain-containing protein [Ruminococcus sp.]